MEVRMVTPNLSAIVANFYAFDAEITRGAQAIVERTGNALVDEVQATVPVATGFMRDQTRAFITPKGMIVSVGWQAEDFEKAGFVFYPVFVILGTIKMPARDVLTPAYMAIEPQFASELSALITEAAARKKAVIAANAAATALPVSKR